MLRLLPLLIVVLLHNVEERLAFKEFFFSVPSGIPAVTEVVLLPVFSTGNTENSSILTVKTLTDTVYSKVPLSSDGGISLPTSLFDEVNSNGVYAHTEDNSLSLALLITSTSYSESYMIYPHQYVTGGLVSEYAIINSGMGNGTSNECYNLVTLVGTEASTLVSITGASMVGNTNGVKLLSTSTSGQLDIVFEKFQTVTLSGSSNGGTSFGSLEGIIVRSNQTVAVISAYVCMDDSSFQVEQIPPSYAWGRRYIIPYFTPANQSQYVTVMASLPSTVVNTTCDSSSNGWRQVQLNRGESHSAEVTKVCRVVSDTPVLVSIILDHNTGRSGITSIVPSIEQSSSNVLIRPFPCSSNGISISLGLSSSNITSLRLNGTILANNITTLAASADSDGGNGLYYTDNVDVNALTTVTVSDGVIMSISFSAGNQGCIYSHPNVYEMEILPAINVTFLQSIYQVLESKEMVTLKIKRTVEWYGIRTRLAIQSDELQLNMDIEFEPWEEQKEVNLMFDDDDLFELNEILLVTISPPNEGVELINAYPIPQSQIIITDNDAITIGLDSIVVKDSLLMVTFGVMEGNLSPSVVINTRLLLSLNGNSTGNSTVSGGTISYQYDTTLTRAVSSVTATIDISVFEYETDTNINATLTTHSTAATAMITINPSTLTETIGTATLDDNKDSAFVIDEFTARSLFIVTCLVGGLVLVIAIISFISIIVCLTFAYKHSKHWSDSGTINHTLFQDDAISLATNDPETYELMNKLGERKTAHLSINDDNAY